MEWVKVRDRRDIRRRSSGVASEEISDRGRERSEFLRILNDPFDPAHCHGHFALSRRGLVFRDDLLDLCPLVSRQPSLLEFRVDRLHVIEVKQRVGN